MTKNETIDNTLKILLIVEIILRIYPQVVPLVLSALRGGKILKPQNYIISMAYKCLKCGSKDTMLLTPKEFSADATFYKGGDIAHGSEVKEINKKLMVCKKCDNAGSPFDKTLFEIVE